MTYLQAMALSRGGQLGEAGGLSGLEGDLLTSNGPESWGAAGRSGRAVGTRWESVGVARVVLLLHRDVVAEICKTKI